jgi:hypothetical protein
MTHIRIMIISGVVLCVLGLFFSGETWSSDLSVMKNIAYAQVVVLEGEKRIVKERDPHILFSLDEYETRGRLAIPLRYVLTVGVLLTAVGLGLLHTRAE